MPKQQIAVNAESSPESIDSNPSFYSETLTASEIYGSLLKNYPDILDVSQVGRILGVSSKTIYRLLNEGTLSSLKVGRAFKIPKLYLLQYIKVLAKS